MKVGDIYYRAGVDDAGKVYIQTWVLRTLRKDTGYLTLQEKGITWEKAGFGERASWSWAKSIPRWCRQRFYLTGADGVAVKQPPGFARSETQAVRLELRHQEAYRTKYPDFDPEELADIDRGIKALKSSLARRMTRKRGVAAKSG